MKKQNKMVFPNFDTIEPFKVSGVPQNMSYKVDIDEDFDHPRQFSEIVDILDGASEGDYMCISLTTSGGALHSILPLLGAMQNTACHIHIHACSDVASAGTFLLMVADSVSVNDYVTVMCHQVSFGSQGSGNTVATHVAHTMKSSEMLIRDMYDKFFSTEEIDRMLSGTDFYMDKSEFLERYDNRATLQRLEYEAEQQQIAEASAEQPKKPAAKKAVKKVVAEV